VKPAHDNQGRDLSRVSVDPFGAAGMDIVRTPDERFAGLPGWPYAPRYLDWSGLRLHYIDEGPRDAPVALLIHGEPTWSYLYRKIVPPLLAAGFRCVAPDHAGFGRSDKPVDDSWYVIARHVAALRFLIETLDLRDITLMVQDWGGPTGLRQAVEMPERFARLAILNTWLHHDGFVYSDGIRRWRAMATDPARLGGDMPTGRIVAGSLRREGHDRAAVAAAYDAPFEHARAKAGARRFPFCIPFAEPEAGDAAAQARDFARLKALDRPVHVIFGDADEVFTADWGRAWASMLRNATFDAVAGAGHFVQEDAGEEVAAILLRRIAGERT
jgi:haloalkane dehalogenase